MTNSELEWNALQTEATVANLRLARLTAYEINVHEMQRDISAVRRSHERSFFRVTRLRLNLKRNGSPTETALWTRPMSRLELLNLMNQRLRRILTPEDISHDSLDIYHYQPLHRLSRAPKNES